MKKVSKVKTVEFIQSWESKTGETYYSHRYIMDDDTQINANHTKMNPFKEGDEVEYEVKGNDKRGNPTGSVGKVSQNNFKGGYKSEPKDEGRIAALSCASSACIRFQQSSASNEQIIELAEVLFKWSLSKSTLKKDA